MSHICNVPRVNVILVTRIKILYKSQFGPHILLILFDLSPNIFKKISISGTPNLYQILLLYNVMIIFIKIDIFIKYFNNINCI